MSTAPPARDVPERWAVPCRGTTPLELGESARWDPVRSELLWTDILAGGLRRGRIRDGDVVETAAHVVDRPLGAAEPLADGSGWVLAAGRGVATLSHDGHLTPLAELAPPGFPPMRMNDAACDARGRIWAGTISMPAGARDGGLYRVNADGSAWQALAGVGLVNGLGWTPSGDGMYVVDSARGVVEHYPFDVASGTLGAARPFVVVDPAGGMPDGLTVDAEGCVWLAVWGAGAVQRHAPDGTLLERVRLSASQPTSCCLVESLLVVTTARMGLTPEALAAQPDAGRLFRVAVGARGRPCGRFGRY